MNLSVAAGGRRPDPLVPSALRAPIVEGVPDHIAAMALGLLDEAPTLSSDELSDWLGITPHQARACRRAAGRGW